MANKPCKTCSRVRKAGQSVKGAVTRALGRKTMAERTEEARDASTQRNPPVQRARAAEVSMSIGTTAGTVVVHGPREAVDIVASAVRRVARPAP